MSRGNTAALPPGADYAAWAAKYRADKAHERALLRKQLRARGPQPAKESRSGEDYEWDAVADADGDDEVRGDEGYTGFMEAL